MTKASPVLDRPAAADCCVPAAGANPAFPAERLAATAKALSEPVRVRIVDLLLRSDEPVCQCELNALFVLKQPVLSHHMKKLVEAGLVDVERRHRWAYYSIATPVLKELTAWLS
jgi:ArsR family transcriptional regulator